MIFVRVGYGSRYTSSNIGERDPSAVTVPNADLARFAQGADMHHLRQLDVGEAYTCYGSYTWVRIK